MSMMPGMQLASCCPGNLARYVALLVTLLTSLANSANMELVTANGQPGGSTNVTINWQGDGTTTFAQYVLTYDPDIFASPNLDDCLEKLSRHDFDRTVVGTIL